MSRFGAMTDSDTSERFGVGEVLGVAGIGMQLAQVLGNIINVFAGTNNKERQSTVEVLLVSLKYIKDTIDGTQLSPPIEKVVRTRLELLLDTAKNLEGRLSHHKAVQVVDVLKNGRFETQVGILRTGLADISTVLQQHGASHQYQYQYGGFPMVQHHPHISTAASPSAPPQVVYNNYYINGARGSNDYGDAIWGRDQGHQAQALNYGHNSGLAYNQPSRVVAYPPVYRHR